MLSDALRAGTYGVRMEIPDGRVTLSEEQILQVIDDARGIVWYVLFEHLSTDLDPQHTEERTRDVDASARAIFHDPALDASLPQHCLSRVRFALAWAQEPGRIRRETHDRATWESIVTLLGFGSIAPPPRFRPTPDHHGAACLFTRSTFATTDGVWRLSTVPLAGGHDMGDRKRFEHAARAKLYEFGIPELDALTAREERADTGARWLHLELAPTASRCPLVSTWWVHDGVARGLLLSAPIEASLAESWAMLRPVTASWRAEDRAANAS